WLWYLTETDADAVAEAAGESVVVVVGNRITLEKQRGDDTERVAIRGEAAQMEEGLVALRKGALVSEVNLVVEIGDQNYSMNVRGADLTVSSLKTPSTGPVRVVDEMEGAILEKAGLLEKALAILDSLFYSFIRLRISDAWEEELPKIRRWVSQAAAAD
ncbi:MAG: hypothetical protein ABIJ95_07530, partial [Pseudomonadota bacterium]